MSCRKCKYFQKEGDREYYIVHFLTTHNGAARKVFEDSWPGINWERIDRMLEEEHKTGRASAHKKFGTTKYLKDAKTS